MPEAVPMPPLWACFGLPRPAPPGLQELVPSLPLHWACDPMNSPHLAMVAMDVAPLTVHEREMMMMMMMMMMMRVGRGPRVPIVRRAEGMGGVTHAFVMHGAWILPP